MINAATARFNGFLQSTNQAVYTISEPVSFCILTGKLFSKNPLFACRNDENGAAAPSEAPGRMRIDPNGKQAAMANAWGLGRGWTYSKAD